MYVSSICEKFKTRLYHSVPKETLNFCVLLVLSFTYNCFQKRKYSCFSRKEASALL